MFEGADHTSEHREIEKDHGRVKTRHCVASDILTRWRFAPDLRPGLRSIVMIESTREIGDTIPTERRYYDSSLPSDAVPIAHAVCSRWGIENGVH